MEEFLSSNGVQYEHHDLATEQKAREYLDSRGIKSVPVTIVDNDQVIIGYYPRKLVAALDLDIDVDLSGKTHWLAHKYDRILGAAVGTTRQLSNAQLMDQVPWRPQSLRDLIMHVLSFPELAWLSHEHGSMSTEDMRASNERLKSVATVEAVAEYGEGQASRAPKRQCRTDSHSWTRPDASAAIIAEHVERMIDRPKVARPA